MDLNLEGKRALVTGSTAGIGAEIARVLAREGAAVAISGRSERRGRALVDEINGAGGKAVLALGDVADDAGADAAAAAALEGLGGVDILVNNAGGFAGSSTVSTLFGVPASDWARTADMNVGAAVRMIQRLVPAMRERGWGRVIQITSSAAMTPSGETPDYAAAKAAMANLSLTVAKALRNTGVTANTVSPGIVLTRSVVRWFKQIGEREGWGDDLAKSEDWLLKHHHPQLVGRIGRVEDIADAVAFLSSGRADYINGANIRIDGGASPSLN